MEVCRSVNYLRLYSKTDTKRRVFSKKASFEDKEVLGEKKMRMAKKYSDNYETERAEEVVRTNASLSLSSYNSSRPVYNRKPMSPLRNQYRPMVFSLSLRTYSQKHSKKNP